MARDPEMKHGVEEQGIINGVCWLLSLKNTVLPLPSASLHLGTMGWRGSVRGPSAQCGEERWAMER